MAPFISRMEFKIGHFEETGINVSYKIGTILAKYEIYK